MEESENVMRLEDLGVVVVDVKGDELRGLYEKRAALVQKDIGRLEEQMGLARKQLEGRREELEHMLQRNPAGIGHGHVHHHGMHGGMDLDHLAAAVETAKRVHEHALFMASHVAPGRRSSRACSGPTASTRASASPTTRA